MCPLGNAYPSTPKFGFKRYLENILKRSGKDHRKEKKKKGMPKSSIFVPDASKNNHWKIKCLLTKQKKKIRYYIHFHTASITGSPKSQILGSCNTFVIKGFLAASCFVNSLVEKKCASSGNRDIILQNVVLLLYFEIYLISLFQSNVSCHGCN